MLRYAAPIIGGIGLFLMLLGFVRASFAFSDAAASTWGDVAVLGLVAFLWYAFLSRPESPNDPEE
jgi:hypothetical protein